MDKRYLSVIDWKKEFGKAETSPDDVIVVSSVPSGVDRKEVSSAGNRSIPFVITDSSEDRDGDTVNVNGWKTDNYLKNPVVLWAHNYSTLPIGKSVSLRLDGGKLKSVAEFVPAEVMPFAETVYQLYLQGYLNAVSVGFQPIQWTYNEQRSGSGWMPAVDFMEQELLEYSCVPVPSNPNALIEARSKGINLAPLKEWAEKTLDEWNGEQGLWVPKSKVVDVFDLINNKKSFSVPALKSADPTDEERIEKATAEIETVIKSGRTLSAANEERLRTANNLIGEVLTQLDNSDKSKAVEVVEGEVLEIDDTDDLIDISPDELKSVIREITNSAMMQLTGKLD